MNTVLSRYALVLLCVGAPAVGRTRSSSTIPMVVVTSSLPAGVYNTPYQFNLTVSGGTGPYMWSVATGQLPSGLSLNTSNGITTLSGTPTVFGSFPGLSFRVKDSSSTPQTATSVSVSLYLFPATPVTSNTTFYVDGVHGSDSNDGVNAPWQTVAKVNSTVLYPGQTVAFASGQTFTGPLTITDSGLSGSPVTFTSFGTGNKPVINGLGGCSTSSTCPGTGSTYNYRSAIEINASWIVVNGLLAQSGHEAGIRIGSGWFSNGADHNIVQNNEITKSGTGLTVSGQYNLITGNYVHDLTEVLNVRGGNSDYGAVGFWIYAPNNEVSYNRAVRCKAQSYDYGTDGGAFETYNDGDNSYIHHNWVQDSNGFLEVGGGTALSLVLAYNVSWNNGDLACLHTSGTFAASVSVAFENNTVVESGSGSLFACISNFNSSMLSLKNNIFNTSGTVYSTNVSFTHVNNLYYGGNAGYTLDSSEISGKNPLFVNASAGNFRLLAGSPAIDSGTNLTKFAYGVDLDRDPVPDAGEATPDIGAYESQYP